MKRLIANIGYATLTLLGIGVVAGLEGLTWNAFDTDSPNRFYFAGAFAVSLAVAIGLTWTYMDGGFERKP